jgi:hypothetical protein
VLLVSWASHRSLRVARQAAADANKLCTAPAALLWDRKIKARCFLFLQANDLAIRPVDPGGKFVSGQ